MTKEELEEARRQLARIDLPERKERLGTSELKALAYEARQLGLSEFLVEALDRIALKHMPEC